MGCICVPCWLYIFTGHHTHTHTPLGSRLPSYTFTTNNFLECLDLRFNTTIDLLLAPSQACDPWIDFHTSPLHYPFPYCPLSVCAFEIKRVANFTRPSILAIQDRDTLVAFSFWLWIERRANAWYSSMWETCDDVRSSLMSFAIANATTLFFVYNFVPWRFGWSILRYMNRTVRPRSGPNQHV